MTTTLIFWFAWWVCAWADPLDDASAITTEATALYAEGRLKEATALFRDSLALRKANLPADHHDVVSSLNNLSVVLQMTGDYQGAKPIYDETIAIRRRRVSDASDPGDESWSELATSLSNLASLHERLGAFDDARALYVEALDIRRASSLVDDSPEADNRLATTLNGLAGLLQAMGELSLARAHQTEALEVWRGFLGDEPHRQMAIGLSNLAGILRYEGDVVASRLRYEQSIQQTITRPWGSPNRIWRCCSRCRGMPRPPHLCSKTVFVSCAASSATTTPTSPRP